MSSIWARRSRSTWWHCEGAFAGGAILPGMAMSARALEEQTDALPRVAVERWLDPPAPLGKATEPAIEAGLFWGAVGAIRELVGQYVEATCVGPDVFVSGGGSQLIASTHFRASWTAA